MNELALFAGAGGGILAGKLLGWTTVGAVEIEEYPREVLLQRQRDGILDPFPIWDDIRTFDARPWRGIVDVVSSGFPCQRNSCVGKIHGSEGFDGWPDTRRVICESRPSYAFLENVQQLLSNGEWRRIAADLSSMGYDLRWGVFCCSDASKDAPTIGARLFAVASSSGFGLEAEEHGLAKPPKGWQPAMPSPAACSIWSFGSPEPGIPVLADGLANYMGEIRAIGNGQVPAVAATAFRILSGQITV